MIYKRSPFFQKRITFMVFEETDIKYPKWQDVHNCINCKHFDQFAAGIDGSIRRICKWFGYDVWQKKIDESPQNVNWALEHFCGGWKPIPADEPEEPAPFGITIEDIKKFDEKQEKEKRQRQLNSLDLQEICLKVLAAGYEDDKKVTEALENVRRLRKEINNSPKEECGIMSQEIIDALIEAMREK